MCLGVPATQPQALEGQRDAHLERCCFRAWPTLYVGHPKLVPHLLWWKLEACLNMQFKSKPNAP